MQGRERERKTLLEHPSCTSLWGSTDLGLLLLGWSRFSNIMCVLGVRSVDYYWQSNTPSSI